jgi:hypothetical protein
MIAIIVSVSAIRGMILGASQEASWAAQWHVWA